MTEEQRKALLAKRAYYSEHPEAALDTLRSLKDDEVDQMIEELVDALCSNPAIARKGIVEMVNSAGYEWPKAYRFDG